MYNNLAVTIHSSIADPSRFKRIVDADGRVVGKGCVSLYYFVRSLDQVDQATKGKGWVEFTITDAATCLERNKSTIWQYLSDGVKLGLFRSVLKIATGKVRVFYSSVIKVALRHELESLGVFAEVPLEDLRNLKVWTTQIVAQSLQQASRFAAMAKRKKKNKVKYDGKGVPSRPEKKKGKLKDPKIPQPEHILRAFSQKSGGKLIQKMGLQCVYVRENFIDYGVSQDRIAKYSDRHKSTVKRRLSNTYRQDKGLKPILKRQLVQQVSSEQKAQFLHYYRSAKTSFPIENIPDKELRKYNRMFLVGKAKFNAGKDREVKVYIKRCNIYDRAYPLKSGRYLKHLYKNTRKSLGQNP